MNIKLNIFFGLWIFIILAIEIFTVAEELPDIDNSLNELYEKLLQREYAGPILFRNHNVERRHNRAPTFRLRYGRSDPDLTDDRIKRWFGDVNQKPIRSPSLRLRFGRRSDPSIPLQHDEDNDFIIDDDLDTMYNDNIYKRQTRPSTRLRWGRSSTIPFAMNLNIEDDNENPMALNNLEQIDENNDKNLNSFGFDRETRKVRKPLRLRWGRSIPSEILSKP